MKGDYLCGYYGILSQLYQNKYGGDSLGPGSNNILARIHADTLKESVVKPYLESLKSIWKDKDDGKTFNNILNGWLDLMKFKLFQIFIVK
jgi:hypothetical protein